MEYKKKESKKNIRQCPCCLILFPVVKNYRTAYCPECTKVIAYQKKLHKLSTKELREFISHYKRLIAEIEVALGYRNWSPFERAKDIMKFRRGLEK